MRVFCYIHPYNDGFAPNPFHGYCTLACCKPRIRLTAREGDWVVGFGAAGTLGRDRVTYAMQVEERLEFGPYFRDPRFTPKRPRGPADLGDNIYAPAGEGFRQLPSRHSNPDGTEDLAHKHGDLRGKFVLASKTFAYSAGGGFLVLPHLQEPLRGRWREKWNFPAAFIADFTAWLARLPRGIVE